MSRDIPTYVPIIIISVNRLLYLFVSYFDMVYRWRDRDPWRNPSFIVDRVISSIVGSAFSSPIWLR